MDNEQKKIIFSGIQPSGMLTIGNYLGSLRNWVGLQDEYECYYCIVDLHAITVRQEPAKLRRNCLELLALYIACGLSPEKSAIYFQSHVPAHSELAWILDCYTYMGELSRMTQYKDKSQKQGANIGSGLFTYPVLMAADILLLQTDLVPVGIDQKQHLELTRDIAIRFNNQFGDVFTVPDGYIPKTGAKIMSLADPTAKMSKSDPDPNAAISVIEEPDSIMRKFKRAVTDSGNEVKFSDEKPGISNLLSIYTEMTGKTISEAEAEFAGRGYGDFKTKVAEAVIERLRPVREEYAKLIKDKAYLTEVAKQGAEKARYIASRTVGKVYKKLGLVAKE